MAEDHVSRDEHRADMSELRGELKEELAGVRQEIAVLAKTMEANQQTMLLRFDQVDQRSEQVQKQMTADREAMLLRFEQADQRHSDLLAAMNQRFDQADRQRDEDRQGMNQRFDQVDKRFELVEQQFSRHETRLMSLENWMRTTYVTLAIVAVGVASQLFYTLLRFGLKGPVP